MLVLIDESGDPGFKSGSSSHFVVGMLIFDRFEDAEDAANIINNLKRDVGYRREFHFSKCDNRKRDDFFTAIIRARFSLRFLVMEKRLLHSHHLKQNKERFISYSLKMLMKFDNNRLQNATVKIDGTGSRIFRKAAKNYLTRELPQGCVAKLKFADSHKDILIQMADMMVSAFSRPYNNPEKNNAFLWRNMLEKEGKIENVWTFR